MVRAGDLPPDTRGGPARHGTQKAGRPHMRARIRFIAPLALALRAHRRLRGVRLLRHRRGRRRAATAASGDACAPVAGDQLVVLEDDKHLQNADNVIPAVNAAAAAGQPGAAAGAERGVGGAHHRGPGRHERRRRRRAEERRRTSPPPGSRRTASPTASSRAAARSPSAGPASPSRTVLANVYADVLKAAGFDATVASVGSRELYLPALEAGTEIQAFPEYLATVTEFLEGDDATAGRQRRRRRDARRRCSRWPRRPGWCSASRPRPSTRTPSPSRRSSPTSSASPRCPSWPTPAATAR